MNRDQKAQVIEEVAGAISDAQADAWLAEQRERGRRGRLFLALPLFVTAATGP